MYIPAVHKMLHSGGENFPILTITFIISHIFKHCNKFHTLFS